jgi:hypothetical protein
MHVLQRVGVSSSKKLRFESPFEDALSDLTDRQVLSENASGTKTEVEAGNPELIRQMSWTVEEYQVLHAELFSEAGKKLEELIWLVRGLSRDAAA